MVQTIWAHKACAQVSCGYRIQPTKLQDSRWEAARLAIWGPKTLGGNSIGIFSTA